MCNRALIVVAFAFTALFSQRLHGEELAVRAYSSIPSSAIEFIARNSVPIRVELKGQTIESVIRATCGYWSEPFAKVQREISGPSDGASKVSIPACIFARRNATIEVQEGDTLTKLLARETGVLPDFKLPCGSEEPSPRCGQSFRQLVNDLNVGVDLDNLQPNRTIIIPYQTRQQTIKLRPDISADSVDQILNQFRFLLQSTAAARLSSSTSLAKSLGVNEIVKEECRLASQSSVKAWPFDIPMVVKVVNRTTSVIQSRGGDPTATVVAILDTGILGKGDLLPNRYFSANFNEKEGGAAADNDRNGYMNDVFGINVALQGDVTAFPQDPRREHGSQVASLVLGSRPFRVAFTRLEKNIKIKIVRLTVPYEGEQFSIAETGILTGLKYANRLGISVANISAGTGRKITEVLDYLKTPPGMIAIVAAGNDASPLVDPPVYPANFGGDAGSGRQNVITVVAHDAKGQIAEFSNYGRDYADIAAPGCDLIYREGSPRLFGTSFSAPLVTFAVAMLRSFSFGLGTDTPLIKQRLEVSSDYDPLLSDAVATSGRLNIAKTLSLYDDVIEVRDGQASKLLFGTWAPTDPAAEELCADGKFTNFIAETVKKITPVQGGRIRVVYRNGADKLVSLFCTPATDAISFIDQGSNEKRLIPWTELLDFVPGQYTH